MATHSSTLSWKIPWAEKPGRVQSMGSWRVRHDWATSLSLFIFMHWRRKWQPTPVFLPGESQGWGSLVGCHLWGRTRTWQKQLSSSSSSSRQHIKKQRHYFANKGRSSQRYGFSSSHVWMWELDYKESWVLKNWCFWTVVLEKTVESPLDCKEIQPVHPKGNQSWMFIGRTDWSWNFNTLASWCEELFFWKRPWCWERLKAGREGDSREWDSWVASLTQWTWAWARSRSWWWTGRPGVLQSMGLQRIRHYWATELNWSALDWSVSRSLTTTELLSQLLFPADAWIKEWTLQSGHGVLLSLNLHNRKLNCWKGYMHYFGITNICRTLSWKGFRQDIVYSVLRNLTFSVFG